LTSGLYGFAGLAAQPVAEIRGTPLLSIALPAFTETPFNHDLFWVLANLAFWCFWLNLMVGITNMLPMIPLDGGHIFRDAIGSVVQVVRPNATAEAREKAVRFAVGGVSIFVLLGMIVMIAGPHLLR
jgi:membrane-associated protease RseP (regulator of RpoE activity)